jgi:hypothetical protein
LSQVGFLASSDRLKPIIRDDVKDNFWLFPDFVAEKELFLLMGLMFSLFPKFVARIRGIHSSRVIAFPAKSGGMGYDKLSVDSSA